jgi:ribose transport system ATP-binding protein
MSSADPQALSLRSVSKLFGGVSALTDVSFELRPGEIVGLVGENGSGKSTLIKIITGFHTPEAGAEGEIWGQPIAFPLTQPVERGIAAVHQDLGLVDDLTVLENVGVGFGYGTRGLRPVNWSAQRRDLVTEIRRFGVDLDPDAMVSRLTPVERAAVAIIRAAFELRRSSRKGEIFVLDEPTSYLTNEEARRLMEMMRSVAASGSSVLFVSHQLKEITEMCDRAVVLRDGRVVANLENEDLRVDAVIRHMLGRELSSFYPSRLPPPRERETVLRVKGLTGKVVTDLSFTVNKGEIVGVTGLAGMGQEELPHLILGASRPKAGLVTSNDGTRVGLSPLKSRRAGVMLVPANRAREGMWPAATASENISLPVLGRFYRTARLRPRLEAAYCGDLMTQFHVMPPDPNRHASTFSGGNQQKIVLAKWLQDTPAVLLLDEPTQGVDAGARREILGTVKEVARAGAGVIIFSSDLEQLANVCNRFLVLWHGRLIASIESDTMDEDTLWTLCQGAHDA